MVYKLRANRAQYMNFYLSPDEIEASIGDYFLLDEPLWSEFWKPIEATFSDDSDNKKVVAIPDITIWATSNNLACNDKAYEVLKDHLSGYGEWLPVTCEGTQYWLLHATKKTGIDAVNTKVSQRTIDVTEHVEIQRLEFIEDKVQDLLVFQTEYSLYKNLYCTDRFKDLIESAGLGGLVFSDDMTNAPF